MALISYRHLEEVLEDLKNKIKENFVEHWGNLKYTSGYKYENLLDYDTVVDGKWFPNENDGTVSDNHNWSIYYIPVSRNEEYTVLRRYPDSGRFVFFNAQRGVEHVMELSRTNLVNNWHRNYITVPDNPNITHMGFCFQSYSSTVNSRGRIMLLKESDIREELEFIPYSNGSMVVIDADKVAMQFNNNTTPLRSNTLVNAVKELSVEVEALGNSSFKQKNILVYGDVFANQRKWQDYVKDYFQSDLTTVAFNDAPLSTLNHTTPNIALSHNDQLTNLSNEINRNNPDVVMIVAGANDIDYDGTNNMAIHSEMKLTGRDIDDFSTTSIQGALGTILTHLLVQHPDVQFLVCTFPNVKLGQGNTNGIENFQNEYKNSIGISVAQINNTIKETTALYGVPCIDIAGLCGIGKLNRKSYLSSPNILSEKGHKAVASAVIGELLRYSKRVN